MFLVVAMRVFAIRLENGDTLIVTAEDKQSALEKLGITVRVFQTLQEQGVDRPHADLVIDGFGPQRYEIREMEHIALARYLTVGHVNLQDMDQITYEALYEGYPILQGADNEIAERWPDPQSIEHHRAEHDALLADAFSHEKTRLMLPAESED
jgi:hypothetical protein